MSSDTRSFRCDERSKCSLARERRTIDRAPDGQYTVAGQPFTCPCGQAGCERRFREIFPQRQSALIKWGAVAGGLAAVVAVAFFWFQPTSASAQAKPEIVTDIATARVESGKGFTQKLEVRGAPAEVVVEGLPPGLSFDAAQAVIAGTPQRGGQFEVRIRAKNAAGETERTFLVTVVETTGGVAAGATAVIPANGPAAATAGGGGGAAAGGPPAFPSPQLATAPAAPAARRAAIFVLNRAGAEFEAKVATFSDYLASRAGTQGFAVINPEHTASAIKPGELDAALAESASRLRLAQNLGADYLLIATINSLTGEEKRFSGYGVQTRNTVVTLRVGYQLLDGAQGGTLGGDTVSESDSRRASGSTTTTIYGLADTLLNQAADKIAGHMGRLAPLPANRLAYATVTVLARVADVSGVPLTVPEIVRKDGKLVATGGSIPIVCEGVTVELDGLAVGTTPAPMRIPPGVHRVRLSRPGFKPWEKNVAISDGQRLDVTLEMTDDFVAKLRNAEEWRHAMETAKLQRAAALEKDRKLTDAEVKSMEGVGKMLGQSGLRLDAQISGDAGFWAKLFQ